METLTRREGTLTPSHDQSTPPQPSGIRPAPEVNWYETARGTLVSTNGATPSLNLSSAPQRGGFTVIHPDTDQLLYDLLHAHTRYSINAANSQTAEQSAIHEKKLSTPRCINTNLEPKELEQVLRKTQSDARLYREERGAHTLYLSLGTLEWSSTDGDTYHSPLLLIPIALTRNSAGQPEIQFGKSDVEENIALRIRLLEEFGISLPPIPSIDTLIPSEYFKSIEQTLSKNKGFKFTLFSEKSGISNLLLGNSLIYQDLNPELWPEEKKPWNNPLVRQLLRAPQTETPDISRSESLLGPIQSHVLPTDSSQSAAMTELAQRENLIISGPPGTGKSVTIANIAAAAVAEGKTVLIVSEKSDALDVNQRWINQGGLGDLCLSMHGTESRKSVIKDLAAVFELGKPTQSSTPLNQNRLSSITTQLNSHARLMGSTIGKSGVTVFQAVSEHMRGSLDAPIALDLSNPEMSTWTQAEFAKARRFAEDLEASLLKLGSPAHNPFFGSELTELSTETATLLSNQLDSLSDKVSVLNHNMASTLHALGLESPLSFAESISAIKAATIIDTINTDSGKLISRCNLNKPEWRENFPQTLETIERVIRFCDLQRKIAQDYSLDCVHKTDFKAIQETLAAHDKKGVIGKIFDSTYRAARATLWECTNLRGDLSSQRSMVKSLVEYQQRFEQCKNDVRIIQVAFGKNFSTDHLSNFHLWAHLKSLSKSLNQFAILTKDHSEHDSLHRLLQSPSSVYAYSTKLETLQKQITDIQSQETKILSALKFNPERAQELFGNTSPDEHEAIISTWRSSTASLESLVSFNALAKTAQGSKHAYLIPRITEAPSVPRGIPQALNHSWYKTLTNHALKIFPLARSFQADTHETALNSLAEAERSARIHNAYRICSKHYASLPGAEFGGRAETLHRELAKEGGHIPIRQLLAEAGAVIQRVKPIFLMSPQAVAKHLQPGKINFDLVLFDEVSQIKPLHALGAILRGSQVVFVGDSQQLPPSQYFERRSKTEIAPLEENEKVESILDLALAAGLPEKNLLWHYRSRRPGLIKISNEQFYDGALKVFPAPYLKEDLHGINFNQIKNGVYESGKRTNLEEARCVACAVIEHAQKSPDQTLGVVALNRPQAELIYTEIEKLLDKKPSLRDFFDTEKQNPFFVKNLESVQGDERDRIIISTTFARDTEGNFSLNLGPLTQPGGERRLNVLFSRAKNSCDLFTSIDPDWDEFTRTNAQGTLLLREYLLHARNGAQDSRNQKGNQELTPLQSFLINKLSAKGYTVHPNIGPAGSGVDLAIVDPANSERYIIGLRLDGEHYSSVESAQDRDLIIPETLRQRGWNIKNVWSLECLKNPEKEVNEIIKAVKTLSRAKAETQSSEQFKPVEIAREAAEESAPNNSRVYSYAQVKLKAKEQKSLSDPKNTISDDYLPLIKDIVDQESPIHRDELHRRVRQILNLTRVSHPLIDLLNEAGALAIQEGAIQMSGDFCLSTANPIITPRDRSNLKGNAKSFTLIAPEEIDAAILSVVKHSYGIKEDKLVDATLNLLGYRASVTGSDTIIQARLKELIEGGMVKRNEGYLESTGGN